jgi:hypothetical protein
MAEQLPCVNASLGICYYYDSPLVCGFEADSDIVSILCLVPWLIC